MQHNLGTYNNLKEVWNRYPNGGGHGDYVIIDGEKLYWNELQTSWGDYEYEPEIIRPGIVYEGDIKVEGTGTFHEGIKIGDSIPGYSGALIDEFGNADYRRVNTDSLFIRDEESGNLVSLAKYIVRFKTELPPNWAEYQKLPLFGSARLLLFDGTSESRYYTTIRDITDAIAAHIEVTGGGEGGGSSIVVIRSDDETVAPSDSNVYSSLATLRQIDLALQFATGAFLSRLHSDTAQGLIKFLQGLEIGDFQSGMHAGQGGAIDSAGNAELESMVLRSFLEVPTIRYNELEYIGEEIIIGAGAVLKGVEHLGDDRYRLTLKLEDGQFNPFQPSDLLKGIYNMDEEGNFTGFGTTYVSVSSIEEHEMIVVLADKSDVVGNSNMPPRKFMHLARIGNFIDEDRQSYISLSAKDRAITQYGGVNAFAKKNSDGLNVRAGVVTTQWGRAEGLEFIENFENLPITKDSDVLYTDTLLYNKQIKIDYKGIVIKEYIDRGQWFEGMECQVTETTIDEVWFEAEKFRLIDRPIENDPFVTTEKPARESEDWMLILSLKEEIDAAVIKATYWSIKASAPVIYKDANSATASGVHTPVTVTGELRSGTTTTQGGFISIQPNGGAESTATASPRTITPTNAEGKTSYTVRLYEKADKVKLLDTMTIPVVFKGASGVNAINVSLSNEADVLPASPEGVVSDYTGSGTIIRVFEGATELAYGTGNGQYQVSASGSGINVGTSSTVGNTRVYGVASSMTSDNATITFTISGKTSSGASFSLTKVQTFAKSRVGQKGKDGEDAVAPIIIDGFWAFWNKAQNKHIKSEFSAIGDDGHAPIIRDGYWYEWNPALEGEDKYQTTNVKAEGKDGEDGYSVSLSKSEHTFNYDKNGNLKRPLSDGVVTVEVMKGSNALICDNSGMLSPTVDNTYRVTSITQSPTSSFSYNIDRTNNVFRLIPVDMTVDEVEITFTIVARTNGINATFNRKLKYQKSYDGTDGDDGLPPEIDTTITQYALGESKTEHPTTGWRDSRDDLIPNEDTPYEWSRQKITYKDSTQVMYVGYVLMTNISPMTYMFGEWDCREKYTRSEKSYPIVTYLKGTNNRPLYYYPKNEGVIEYTWFVNPNVNYSSTWYKQNDLVLYENDGSNGDPVCPLGIFRSRYNDNKSLPSVSSWWGECDGKYAPNGEEGQKLWEFADGVELIITEALMANYAKLDSFVFHKGKMFSQEDSKWESGSNEYTDDDHEPNFEVNGISGKVKMKGAEISGKVDADEGSIGVLNVNRSGQVSVLDPSSNAERLIINADNLPDLSSLINGTNTGDSVNNNSRWGETSVYTFPTKLVVLKNGSNIRIQTSLGLTMVGGSQGELAGSAYASLELRKTGMTDLPIGIVMLAAKTNEINEKTISIDRTFTGMSSGTYSLVLRVAKVGDVSSAEGRTTSSTLSYTHQVQGVSRAQIGLDGLMLFYTQNHLHFSATQGLKVGGDVSIEGNTNMNGILLAVDKRVGSFSNTTSFNQKWGIARLTNVSMSRVGNVVKLYHYLGHTDYFVTGNINAGTSGLENIKTYANYCEVTMAGNIGDNHNIQLMLIGQNK